MAGTVHSSLEELGWAAIEPKATAVPENLRNALKSIVTENEEVVGGAVWV